MRLKDKVALISGGARGLGAADARLFAKEGAKVVIGDVLETEGPQVEREINEAGGKALFVHLDVTSEAEWQNAVATCVSHFGKLDILVNNAGISLRSSLEETSAEEWDRVMAINVKGMYLGIKLAIPEMLKAGGGSIINISSQVGLVGSETSSAHYQASKGAVRLLSKVTATHYAKQGIRVNSVHPGPMVTPMTEATRGEAERHKLTLSRIPMGRYGQPEEVANGVLFLASEESSFMTGSELVIDGGWTAQ